MCATCAASGAGGGTATTRASQRARARPPGRARRPTDLAMDPWLARHRPGPRHQHGVGHSA
eukprot:10942517-Lingulodinium_polyedra.AAC.1